MSSVWIDVGIGLGGFLAGVGAMLLIRVMRSRRMRSERADASASGVFDDAETGPQEEAALDTRPRAAQGPTPASSQLSTIIAQAIREPLRQLRRSEGCPSTALRQLERIAWQTRMLGSSLRPMQAQPVSPVALLQQAAEQVPLLRDGAVAASWSLHSQRPIQVDPERARVAFREIMAASAESAGEGGRLAIRVLKDDANGGLIQIELESGRPGSEADPLAFLVARRLLETQGGRVELDGRVTRIHLRGSSPSPEPRA